MLNQKPKRNRIPNDISIGYLIANSIKPIRDRIVKVYYDDRNPMCYNVLNKITYRIL